jgi:hypothetical protein
MIVSISTQRYNTMNDVHEPNNAGSPNNKITEYSLANQLVPLPKSLSSTSATMFGRRRVPRRELPRARRAVTVGLLRTRAWGVGFEDE